LVARLAGRQVYFPHRQTADAQVMPACERLGIGQFASVPLAQGVLTGKYGNGVPSDSRAAIKGFEWLADRILEPTRLAKVQSLVPLARELGCTLAQMSIAWCLRNPNVSTVITGASRPSQVTENLQALSVVPKLTPEIVARIEAATA